MRIYGVDFTCAPRRAKPITVAAGTLRRTVLDLHAVERLESFAAFEELLRRPGPWVGGFDFPFALPLALLADLKFPKAWKESVRHCAALSRQELRSVLDAYRATRPAGSKYVHRATDYPAGSSSPMKLVNPPVALMFHEGAPRLVAAGVHVPALMEGDPKRVALEAYPGLLVRGQLGLRASYKSDTRAEQTPARRAIRWNVVKALERGEPLGIRLRLSDPLRRQIVREGAGDLLDAAISAMQAAWAAGRPGYGLPPEALSGEGWIVSAGFSPAVFSTAGFSTASRR